jgi:transmembrane sensor
VSSTDPEKPSIESARDVDRQAASWLQRQQFWNWTTDDQTQFNSWLDQSTAHRIAYVRVNDAWNRTHRLTILRAPVPAREAERTGLRIWTIFNKAVAALIVIVVLVAAAMVYLGVPHEDVIATAVGGHRLVELRDGSTVELSTDTVVRISQINDARTVKLDRGEAYFQVKHDTARPFTVTAGDRQLTDLGTKFVVRRDSDRVDVSVIEGRILFDTKQGLQRQVALLTAGDEVVATEKSITRLKRSPQQLSNRLAWRRGVLVFKNTPLMDAVAEFNRYHSEKLVVLDSRTGHLTIGGTFETNNILAFTEVAQDVLGLRVIGRGDEIVLSR